MRCKLAALGVIAAVVAVLAMACEAEPASVTADNGTPPVTSAQTASSATLMVSAQTPLTLEQTSTARPSAAATSSLTTVEIVRELRPSVVHIQTELAPQGLFVLPTPSQGVGTGSVIDDQGHILTNNHVIEGARQITVALNDGRTFTASVVGADSFTDLAVLKVDAPNLAPARLGDSDKLEVGEDVVAIGYALDLDGGPTVTRGVVSAVGRSIEKSASVTLDGLIQTDAAINPGNSGGPLVNSRGEIVGVNTAVSGEAQGIGFAISINQAKAIAQQLLENGQVTRAYLGIRLATLAPAIARVNSLPVQRGVIVQTVDPNTPAARAGLRAGDIIVSMGGQAIPNSARLFRFLVENKPGTTVDIEYYRGANKTSGKITLGQRPAS